MITQDCAGASSHEIEAWDSIDWTQCRREVRRLQARIVKATRQGESPAMAADSLVLRKSIVRQTSH